MAITNLISEAYFRSIVPFNGNVDATDLTTHFAVAQDMFVEPILGSTFYDVLQLAYSGQTLTPVEEALVLEIKPFLAYKTAVMILPFLAYSVKAKGPQIQFGDNSASVDNSVMFYLKKEIDNRAEWYGTRLERYLYLNSALFPTYQSQASNQDVVADKDGTSYDSGFSLYDSCNNINRCGSGFNGFFNRF